MKWLLYFLREENYVTVRKNDVNKAFMLLYEKYCSFIFLSYFTPHHPFQWVKYSSNQKIIWSSGYTITTKENVRFEEKMHPEIFWLDQIQNGCLSACIYFKFLMPDIW